MMFLLLILLALPGYGLDLRPEDRSVLLEIAKNSSIPILLREIKANFTDLRIHLIGENPIWRDKRDSDADLLFFRKYESDYALYIPAYKSLLPLHIRKYPHILLPAQPENGDVLHELLHYLVDRFRLGKLTHEQQSEPISYADRIRTEIEQQLSVEMDRSHESFIMIQGLVKATELLHLDEAEIVLFISENSEALNVSREQALSQLSYGAKHFVDFITRINHHQDLINRNYPDQSNDFSFLENALLKAAHLGKKIYHEANRQRCAQFLDTRLN